MVTDAPLLPAVPPSELVHANASDDAERGRNDLCTCASGRTWKHCHGGP